AYCFRLNEWTVLTGVQWLPVFVSLCMALPIFIVITQKLESSSKARARLATRGIASRGATSACIGIKNHPERGVSVGVFSGIAYQRLA
ncbi:hypothetical protein, partial [Rhizobium leguminosarum]|uniref:hypothetical protein n=1 Tax=Rhizobium leguminosarum TaxID=384 RepID=UPI003F9BFAAB